MSDIGSELLLAKRPGARRQHAPRFGKSTFYEFCFPFFAFFVCACACVAPDPDLEGSTEKLIHSHEKIAVAAATAAWRNAGQNITDYESRESVCTLL